VSIPASEIARKGDAVLMSRIGALFFLISTTALLPSSASALVLAGDLPIFRGRDIEIAGGLAYVVSAEDSYTDLPTLSILDLSNPTSPVEIGSFDTPYGADDVEVVGGLAYITDDNFAGSLRIIDVSDPTAPVEIGAFDTVYKAADVEVVGSFAYLVDQFCVPRDPTPGHCGSLFHVIDVSNPALPVQVSERYISFWVDIEAVEGVVYAAGEDLEVIDVSNPATPVTVALLPYLYAEAIEVVGGHLYATSLWPKFDLATNDWFGFEVIDVMDPTNPIKVGHSSGTGRSIEIAGDFAYLGNLGVTVVDISNPAAPVRRGSVISSSEPSYALAVYGGHAYHVQHDRVDIVDLSVRETPVEVGWTVLEGSIAPPASVNDVEISDDIAYLAIGEDRGWEDSGKGLRTMDVSDPTAPSLLGGIETADFALDVELASGLAFVAAGTDGLRVFDVANPGAPVAAGALALPGSTAKLEVVGTTAYVVDRGISRETFRALRVVDVSNATAPAVLGAIEFTDSHFECLIPGVAVVEKLAYVTCRGLYIVDVSDPLQPALIFAERMSLHESSIQVAGDQAYIGDNWHSTLSVYDVSDPTQPVAVSHVDGGGREIRVEDGFAYSAGKRGLFVHDLEDPLLPVLRGGYPGERGSWYGLDIADGLIFGGTSRGALQVVDLGPEYTGAHSVEIAIRAQGEPALVNLASRGAIGVTILGAADFDVAQIDRATLRFGPASAAPAHKAGGHLLDANGDANSDLLSHYWTADTGLSEANENVCVSGQTFDGTPIRGCGRVDVMLPRGHANASSAAN
jgi:hypothetical protein